MPIKGAGLGAFPKGTALWLGPGRSPDLARLPVGLNPRAISVLEGVRAGLSTALIVAAAEVLNYPPLMEMALGAMLTCLCDAGGPIRRRAPALLTFMVLGALFTSVFGLLRAAGLATALPLACLGIFCTSFLRIWGQTALQLGNLLTVVLILGLDRPLDGPEALLLGGLFAAGSLWAFVLTMLLWRLHPYRPARQAVAEAWLRLAELADDLRNLVRRENIGIPEWEAHARVHRGAVREAIELARQTVMDTARRRGPLSARTQQNVLRLETAEQLFGTMIALSERLEVTGDATLKEAASRMLRRLRPLLAVLARGIVTDSIARVPRLPQSIAGMGEGVTNTALAPFLAAITQRLMIATKLAVPDGDLPGGAGPGEPRVPWRDRLIAPLRANLSWNSVSLRHATRAAAVALPALLLSLIWEERGGATYPHWLSIVLILTLQPFFALTWQRALERIGGTLLGGLVAAGLTFVVHTPLETAAAIFPLAIIAFMLRAVSFGLFMAWLTPLVVLLSEASQPGTSEWAIAAWRSAFTISGGLLAIAGSALLWPSWEPDRLRRELFTAVRTHADYADAALGAIATGQVASPAIDTARRAAGLASNNLEASLTRALVEPLPGQRERLDAAMVVDAALRRLAGRLAATLFDPAHRGAMPADHWQLWRAWVVAALRALPTGDPLPARPPPPLTNALGRMAAQIDLMDGAMRRYQSGASPRTPSRAAPLEPDC